MSVYKNDDPEYFKIALESVTTNQSLKPSQIVIVFDGPVHEEIENIVEQVKEKNESIHFDLIKKEKNEGLAAALNTAIDYCKYDWIARMDSDDYALPNRFEKQFAYINSHPEISIIGSYICEFNKNIGDMKSLRVVPKEHENIKKMMKKRNPMNHISICYYKDAVIKSGKYCVSFGKLEDYKLWVDMMNAGYKFANIPDVLVYARVGNGFFERRSSKREISDWDMLQKYLVQNKFINSFQALINKVYIRIFIYMPKWMKKIAYKYFLRK